MITITVASPFLVGVAAWFGARYWTFGHYSSISIAVGSALAIISDANYEAEVDRIAELEQVQEFLSK
jgi:hypothetical protein